MSKRNVTCVLFVVLVLLSSNLMGSIIIGLGNYTSKLNDLYVPYPSPLISNSLHGHGFQFGLESPIKLFNSKHFFIQPGLYYVKKGGKLLVGDFASQQNIYDLRYIQLPVALKFKYANFYVLAGGYGAINTRARKTITIAGDSLTSDIKNNVKSLEFGLTAGIGYEFRVRRSSYFLIETRYEKGLTNIFGKSNLMGAESWGKNSATRFMIGYRF